MDTDQSTTRSRRRTSPRARLSKADWAHAALTAIGKGGLSAVAVEPLAAQLGTTKGSFYWHFANRDALLEAALERWERERTEEVIDAMRNEPQPVTRLRRLFGSAVKTGTEDRIELTLLATADHPLVAPPLLRVTQRRVQYLAEVFSELGLAPVAAESRALLAYSAYLGYLQMAHATPVLLPTTPRQRQRYLHGVIDALIPR